MASEEGEIRLGVKNGLLRIVEIHDVRAAVVVLFFRPR
jgi:hypothetical protein